MRVDKMKNELEKVREDFHREVDQIGDEALEQVFFKLEIDIKNL